jgi:hypothetical protein
MNSMNWKILKKPTLLNLISAIILVVGLGSAAMIYQKAGNDVYGAIGYEVINGNIYPIMPEHSKMYRHNLELYGGKMNVLADDFRRWLVGLWHGRSLAVIIGCTTIIISFGFFYAANHLTHRLNSDIDNKTNRDDID